jgi:hypothetical protein
MCDGRSQINDDQVLPLQQASEDEDEDEGRTSSNVERKTKVTIPSRTNLVEGTMHCYRCVTYAAAR